jgi:hypothetical protein
LLNGILNHPLLSLRLLEEIYHQQTGGHADFTTFSKALKRLNPAYFGTLYAQLRQKMAPQLSAADAQALRLRWVDATIVGLSAKMMSWGLLSGTRNPDRARRQVKSVIALQEDGLPHLLRVCKDPGEISDCLALGDTMLAATSAGDLWIFDKGCHDRKRLLKLHHKGAFWLTPHSQQGFQNVQTLLEAPADRFPAAPPATSGRAWVVLRVEQAVFGNGQETAGEQAHWDQMPLILVHLLRFDQRTRRWTAMTLMTNLTFSEDGQHAGPYSWDELAQLYGNRWDIEVFFRFIKQHLNYDHLTNRSENGVRILIYMSLIAALLLIWYKHQSGIDRGWKAVKFWFAEQVREWTRQLLQAQPLVPDG